MNATEADFGFIYDVIHAAGVDLKQKESLP